MDGDIQLLRRYVETRDAQAFADLVRRHAGMVYGACLRMTGDTHAAEDGSQECFLVLARRAGSVRDSVGAWLHATAINISKSQIRGEVRRRQREGDVAAMNAKEPQDPKWAEISPFVDEALAELACELRETLIRQFLENKTQAQVADELGIDQSTVSRRIDKGLELLRAALKRKGMIVTSAALGALLVGNSAHAAPAALTLALGKMAMAGVSVGGKGAAMGAGTKATGIGGATMTKLGIAALAVAAAVTIGAMTSKPATQKIESGATANSTEDVPAETRQADEKMPEWAIVADKPFLLNGTVMGLRGKPLENTKVILYHNRTPYGQGNEIVAEVRTDANGQYQFPKVQFDNKIENMDPPDTYLVLAVHDGYSFGWTRIHRRNVDHSHDIALDYPVRIDYNITNRAGEPLTGAHVWLKFVDTMNREFELPTEVEPLSVRVNDEGMAVVMNASERAWYQVSMEGYASDGGFGKNRIRLNAGAVVSGQLLTPERKPLADASLWLIPDAIYVGEMLSYFVKTDADGKFKFKDLPSTGYGRDGKFPGKFKFCLRNQPYIISSPAIQLQRGQMVEDMVLTTEPGIEITVTLVDRLTKLPVAGAMLLYIEGDAPREDEPGMEIFTGFDGTVKVVVPPGKCTFRFTEPPEGLVCQPESINAEIPSSLVIDAADAPLMVTLATSGRIEKEQPNSPRTHPVRSIGGYQGGRP